MDPSFESLYNANIFSKLDLRNAYHLIRIKEGLEWNIAFNTPIGHFECLVLLFGHVNDILSSMLNQFVFVYLDDILIHSSSLGVHQQQFSLLEINPKKCEFHSPSVSFLGYVIAQGQLQPDPAKIQAVSTWSTPTSVKELQRFLGFANFYTIFIKEFSKVVAAAVSCLESLFTSAPVLRHPDPLLQFEVEVDDERTAAMNSLKRLSKHL